VIKTGDGRRKEIVGDALHLLYSPGETGEITPAVKFDCYWHDAGEAQERFEAETKKKRAEGDSPGAD